jgi:hypothetical protein
VVTEADVISEINEAEAVVTTETDGDKKAALVAAAFSFPSAGVDAEAVVSNEATAVDDAGSILDGKLATGTTDCSGLGGRGCTAGVDDPSCAKRFSTPAG